MNRSTVSLVFLVAAIYDFAIGVAFLFFGEPMFNRAGVPQPNHWGYIQFGASLLMVFGIMFLAIAMNYDANRNLIPYGMLLKVCYVSVAGYYWAVTGLPFLFKPFVVIDVLMLVLFIWSFVSFPKREAIAKA